MRVVVASSTCQSAGRPTSGRLKAAVWGSADRRWTGPVSGHGAVGQELVGHLIQMRSRVPLRRYNPIHSSPAEITTQTPIRTYGFQDRATPSTSPTNASMH